MICSKVFSAIIHGPTAAREIMSGIATNPKNDTMARKYRLRHITPGAIAATAILVCILYFSFYTPILLTLIGILRVAGHFHRTTGSKMLAITLASIMQETSTNTFTFSFLGFEGRRSVY